MVMFHWEGMKMICTLDDLISSEELQIENKKTINHSSKGFSSKASICTL